MPWGGMFRVQPSPRPRRRFVLLAVFIWNIHSGIAGLHEHSIVGGVHTKIRALLQNSGQGVSYRCLNMGEQSNNVPGRGVVALDWYDWQPDYQRAVCSCASRGHSAAQEAFRRSRSPTTLKPYWVDFPYRTMMHLLRHEMLSRGVRIDSCIQT